MKKIFLVLFLIPIFLASVGKDAFAGDPLRVEIFPKVIRQGDVFLVRASGPGAFKSVHGDFQGKRFSIAPEENNRAYEGLVGIDLDTKPAGYELKVTATGGSGHSYSKTIRLKVEKADFAVQRLTLPRSMVDLDPKTLERVNRESKRLRELFQGIREERFWKGPFIRPVEGEISGSFGNRRIINGQKKSPHSGIDLRAEEGTPVLACNGGRVSLVEEFFFSGKSVVLDHGEGLYSMYFHLSETRVSEREQVRAGDPLGRVGSTGRSTGPHLHWGIILRGARVDPLSFLRLNQYFRE